jgi:hypothetical protein
MSSNELQNLTDAVAHQMSLVFGEGANLDPATPAGLHGRYSFMFHYRIRLPDGIIKSIIVKIPRDAWMKTLHEAISSDHIRGIITTEFEILNAIADAVEGEPLLCAIRPLAILPEFNAVVMDDVEMTLLKTSLSRFSPTWVNSEDWKQFEGPLELAGKLLRVIHSRFATTQQESLESLRVLENPAESLDALGHHDRSSNALLHPLIDLYESVKSVRVPLAGLHNDYHLGNVFVTPEGKVGTLDPNWTASGSVYVDLACIISYPQTRRVQVLTQGLRFPSSLREPYETALLRGYFTGSQVSYPVLYFYCATAALEKWRYIEDLLRELPRAGSWAASRWVRHYFHGLIRQYLEQGLKASASNRQLDDREHLAPLSCS